MSKTIYPLIIQPFPADSLGSYEGDVNMHQIACVGWKHRGLKFPPLIEPGIHLVTEPDNKHDPFAIKVVSKEGKHIGYVPKALAHSLTVLIGKYPKRFLRAKADSEQPYPIKWLKKYPLLILHCIRPDSPPKVKATPTWYLSLYGADLSKLKRSSKDTPGLIPASVTK